MNRKSYLKIIEALVNLMYVIIVEAGRVPVNTAITMCKSIIKALTGGTGKFEE